MYFTIALICSSLEGRGEGRHRTGLADLDALDHLGIA